MGRPAFTYFPSRIKLSSGHLLPILEPFPHGTQAKGKPAVMPGRKSLDLSHPGQTAGVTQGDLRVCGPSMACCRSLVPCCDCAFPGIEAKTKQGR